MLYTSGKPKGVCVELVCVVVATSLLALAEADADGVTLLNGTPSALRALLDAGRLPASARVVVLGGEALGRGTVTALHAWSPSVRVVNVYGPTECTDLCIAAEMPRGGDGPPPIGRPISNTRALVLSPASMAPVPVGVSGELYVGGAGESVGRGLGGSVGMASQQAHSSPPPQPRAS